MGQRRGDRPRVELPVEGRGLADLSAGKTYRRARPLDRSIGLEHRFFLVEESG